MIQTIAQLSKALLKKVPLYRCYKQIKANSLIREWESSGKQPPPPHIIKQRFLSAMIDKYKVETVIETGTFNGDMIEALKGKVKHFYSIELSEYYYQKAIQKFRKDKNVHLINGDSGSELRELIAKLPSSNKKFILFWLDGHFSGGETAKANKNTPIKEELNSILKSHLEKYIIVIDDLRLFGSEIDYPTIDDLRKTIFEIAPKTSFAINKEVDNITIISG